MAKITDIAHLFLKEHIKPGDIVVDATCGNGHDTLFLAQLVGQSGLVHAYDIQIEAINHSQQLTKDYHNIIFHHDSHEHINVDNIKAVIFNLGYLPNGDKNITTTYDSTKSALLHLISTYNVNKQMLIVIVVYPGHNEGLKESEWLDYYLAHLDSSFLVSKYQPINQNKSPYILTITKKSSK